jgi:NAD-dependent deacetylase
MDAAGEAFEILKGCPRIAAFTGAGISAESGIPTYRGAGGVWGKYDPSRVAHIETFREDPSLYWEFFRAVRYPSLRDAKPNAGHQALARLEAEGRLAGVITQNIDGLHQAAGSKQVIEIHGNSRHIACLDCGMVFGIEEVQQQMVEGGKKVPSCAECGGRLKPAGVFFGEGLPPDALREAAEATQTCDAMLCVGSSLVVYPAAGFPESVAARGAPVLVVNADPTPLDPYARFVTRIPAGTFLPALAERLLGGSP